MPRTPCQRTRRSLHSAPIDNRWNKKLEFVYSLVTQIGAAVHHPPLPSSPFAVNPSPPPTPTTNDGVSSQTRNAPLSPLSSSIPTSSQFTRITGAGHQPRSKANPTPTVARMPTSIPISRNVEQYGNTTAAHHHRDTTTTANVTHTDFPYHFIFPPLFPPPFRTVRQVCRTTCPSWSRMHLSNGETNWETAHKYQRDGCRAYSSTT